MLSVIKTDISLQVLLLFSVSLALLSSIILPYTHIAIILVLLVTILYIYKLPAFIILIILSFITATGTGLVSIRPYLNMLSILLLLIVFLKYNKINISELPSIPVGIKYFIWLLFGALLVSTVFSESVMTSLLADFKTITFFTIVYLFYALLTKFDSLIYMYSILLSVIILSVAIMFQIVNAGFTIFLVQGALARFAGLYGNPNSVGLIIFVSITFAIALFFSPAFQNGYKRFLLKCFLLINFFSLVVVNSRSSILAVFIGTSFVLLVLNTKLYLKIRISLVVVGLVLYQLPIVQEFIEIVMRLDELEGRDYYWLAGFDVINDYPLFGAGPDIFHLIFFSYLPSAALGFYGIGGSEFSKPSTHNFFLLMTAENGILGFFVFRIPVCCFFLLFHTVVEIGKK